MFIHVIALLPFIVTVGHQALRVWQEGQGPGGYHDWHGANPGAQDPEDVLPPPPVHRQG